MNDYFESRRERTENALAHEIANLTSIPPRLVAGMEYSLLKGGKRIRPLLVYASGEALGANIDDLDASACAIEMIHAYSLVHDDLPAMDNADLRRGFPSCHRAFDEATAILVGDALLTLAFELLANFPSERSSALQKIKMIRILSSAVGAKGMVGGQQLDLALNQTTPTLAELENIYQMKTGALIQSCVKLGAITADCTDEATLQTLDEFATSIGLAFQIQDDILDIESTTQALGKSQGKDNELNKITVPVLIGVEAAKQRMEALYQQAFSSLNRLDSSDYLREFSLQLYQRLW